MEDANLLEAADNILQAEEDDNSPTFLYNKEAVSRGLLWDDGSSAVTVKNAQFTFILLIVFFIGLYLVYNLYAFLDRCRRKIQPVIPWRLLPGIQSSSTSPEAQPETTEQNSALRGRMEGDGGSVAEFVFPPVHLAKAKGLAHLQPSPMHVPPDKRNPDAEEIIVFLPIFPISPPSSTLDLSNPGGDREVSLNPTYGSDRNL